MDLIALRDIYKIYHLGEVVVLYLLCGMMNIGLGPCSLYVVYSALH